MVLTLKNLREGGGPSQNNRTFLLGCGSGHPYFWIKDVGGDPTYGPHPVEFPPKGGKKAAKYSTTETNIWKLGI